MDIKELNFAQRKRKGNNNVKRSDDSVTKGSVFDARKIFLSYLHSGCRLIECSYNHSDEEEEYA